MKLTFTLMLFVLSFDLLAQKLSDLRPFHFEVLFTNPVCKTYSYDRPVVTNSGNVVLSKPSNVYCKPSDEADSVARENSPQFRLIEWISDKNTKEIHLAYLSFSSRNVVSALCDALKSGKKVRIILDKGNGELNKSAEGLKSCGNEAQVEVYYRGSTGGLGFAHNKIMMINPGNAETKIVFSSGNMTSGTSTNHENWNFVTTAGHSYFALAHKCALDGMVYAGDKKGNFSQYLRECRSKIKARPETDIRVYFAPTDGKEAYKIVEWAGFNSDLIEAMSHRFSGSIANLFINFLNQGKKVKFILDDDVYWSAALNKDIGRNTRFEAYKIFNEIVSKGMETKFLQTNQNVYQLQHNKFMIFTFKNDGAVFNGAGNFTSAAFTKNFENFYYIEIPEVVQKYQEQYTIYFDQMATAPKDMPRDYLLP